MAEIIKTYKQSIPAMRFIGKKYTDEDRVDGSFGAKWGEWFQNGWFEVIESLCDDEFIKIYEDGKAYIGLMKEVNDGFEYKQMEENDEFRVNCFLRNNGR